MKKFDFPLKKVLKNDPQQTMFFEVKIRNLWFCLSKTEVLGCPWSQKTTIKSVFFVCVCVFFDLLVSLFWSIFCHNIIIFRNPWFYLSKTEVCEGISSCVMEAKKWPTSILAVRRVKTALSCESGVHFREGTQRVFACELYMMVG